MKRSALATLAALAMWTSVAGGAFAQATSPSQPAPAAPAKPKFVKPIKGVAEIGYLRPQVKVAGNEVVTTMKIKNLSNGAIAGLRVDEFWYDKAGGMLPGDSKRVRQPIMPGEVVTVELRTPRNPKMDRNSYQFTHANGTCKPKILSKL
jgi:hypothetical protein